MPELIDCGCYLCDSTDRSPWGRENGYDAWKCRDCGLVYVSPRPSDADISQANLLGEHRAADGKAIETGHWSDRKVARYRKIFSAMFADVCASNEPVDWLDVGAGFGEAVAALQQILPAGSSVLGIEPSAAKVREAQRRKLPIIQRDLSDIQQKFDFISLINLFSHVPEFGGFMTRIRELLSPRGEIFFESSNGADLRSANDYPDALFLPDHLMFCGRDILRRYLEPLSFVITAERHERRDTALWLAKSAVKLMIGRQARLTVPYTSDYRIVMARASLRDERSKSMMAEKRRANTGVGALS